MTKAGDDDDNEVDGNGATGDNDGSVSYYNIVKLIIVSHEEPRAASSQSLISLCIGLMQLYPFLPFFTLYRVKWITLRC
jgi:hypothetical protein